MIRVRLSLYILLILLCACSNEEQGNILDAVPDDFALVLESETPKEMLDFVESNAKMLGFWNDFAKDLHDLDSLLRVDAKTQQYYQKAHTICLLSSCDDQLVSALVLYDDKILSNKYLAEIKKDNHLVVHNGFLIYSMNERLLVEMQEQLEKPEKVHYDADFKRVQNTLGQSVPIHLFINYDVFGTLIDNLVPSKYQEFVSEFFAQYKGFAAMDVQSKPEVLMTNGYSVATDSLSSLRPLKYQVPVHNSIVNLLPRNTKLMLHYGMLDYASYWDEFADFEQVDRLNKRYRVDVGQQLIACFSEVSYCVFDVSEKPVFVGRMNDPAAVMQFMEKLGAKVGVTENVVVQGYTIRNLNVKSLIPDVFGKYFQNITGCCYAIVDQYLVVANDFQTIHNVISSYRSGRTLDLSESFKSFQDNMLESDNVCLYWVSSGLQSTLQLAASKDLVYTSFSMKETTETVEETNTQWKVSLDAPIHGKPYFVRDAYGRTKIVVFDLENSMYLIDNNGNILWKMSVPEPPMSKIEVVDYYRDGQLQLLFNSANYLELIDFYGNNVDNYPKRLLCEASNGLSVFDYDGNKTYRIMICGTDRFVYNYDLRGEETEGWNRHRAEEIVTQPLQHLVADNKDFIIVTDINGTAHILDRQGRIRIPLKADLHKSHNADFYENKTNHKGIMLTTDETGQLLYVAFDGGLARTDFGAYSDKHCFLYEDFNGDQDPDFIYLDGKQLRVFDRFKKLLYSYDFDAEITEKPVFYRLSRNKWLLGLISESVREVYLIDKNGNMTVSSGLIGGTSFAIGSKDGNNGVNLLSGEGNVLFNYLIY